MTAREPSQAMQDAAEQVRDHLVQLRGGAPFLSPVDAKLLLEWLESGIGVAIIVRALETVAARRQARRTRSPFSLSSAKGTVKKAVKQKKMHPATAGLAPLVRALEVSKDPHEQAMANSLASLEGEGEALVEAALEVVRRFFEARLDEADAETAWRTAETELEDLKGVLSKKQWERAVGEVCRQQIRDAHPLLSAASIWDTVFR
jgi:hypothetical protein